jgi:hypothetical protein
MRTHTLVRGAAVAGLAAASATAAHGGAAALSEPAWSLPALAGAAVGVAALLRLLHCAGRARRAAASVRLGARAQAGPAPLGLAETTAVMLAAQGLAHVALIAAGAPAHSGQIGALALHTGLALLGAAAVWAADRILARALADLGAAVSAAAELLVGLALPRPAAPCPAPAGFSHTGRRHGRAPPAAA